MLAIAYVFAEFSPVVLLRRFAQFRLEILYPSRIANHWPRLSIVRLECYGFLIVSWTKKLTTRVTVD